MVEEMKEGKSILRGTVDEEFSDLHRWLRRTHAEFMELAEHAPSKSAAARLREQAKGIGVVLSHVGHRIEFYMPPGGPNA